MTNSTEARRLVNAHVEWLRPRVRTAQAEGDPPTIVSRRRCLLHADRHLPHGLLDREVGTHLEAYLSRWNGWSRYTYDTHLRGFYHWGHRGGIFFVHPMADIPKPAQGESIPHPCTDGELAAALTAPEPYGTAAALGGYMGLRAGEIARADRAHVIRGVLRIRGKGGRTRTVPIAPQIEHIILGASGPLLGHQVTEKALIHGQRNAWRAVGLPDTFTLHSARHWFATRLLESGALITEVQRLLGHSSLVTTQIYLAVTDDRMAAAVGRLPVVVKGTSRTLTGSSPTPASRAA